MGKGEGGGRWEMGKGEGGGRWEVGKDSNLFVHIKRNYYSIVHTQAR